MSRCDDFPLFTSPYASPYDLTTHAYPFMAYDAYGQLVAPDVQEEIDFFKEMKEEEEEYEYGRRRDE